MTKKTQTERMLSMLFSGVPPEKVRAEFPKRGVTLAKAIEIFLEKATPQVGDLQRKIVPLESQVKTLEGEIGLKNKQIIELDNNISEKKKPSIISRVNGACFIKSSLLFPSRIQSISEVHPCQEPI